MSSNPRHVRQERREFIRVSQECTVEYRFAGSAPRLNPDEVHTGTTNNISGGGMKLTGALPNTDWIPHLLLGRVVLALTIHLPDLAEPVRAAARAARLEVADREKCTFIIGLRFREISPDDREKIIQFIIKSQIS